MSGCWGRVLTFSESQGVGSRPQRPHPHPVPLPRCAQQGLHGARVPTEAAGAPGHWSPAVPPVLPAETHCPCRRGRNGLGRSPSPGPPWRPRPWPAVVSFLSQGQPSVLPTRPRTQANLWKPGGGGGVGVEGVERGPPANCFRTPTSEQDGCSFLFALGFLLPDTMSKGTITPTETRDSGRRSRRRWLLWAACQPVGRSGTGLLWSDDGLCWGVGVGALRGAPGCPRDPPGVGRRQSSVGQWEELELCGCPGSNPTPARANCWTRLATQLPSRQLPRL